MDPKKTLLKKWIDEAKSIVFFGGAGVSTESGVPDFRSKDGLYNQHDVRFERYQPEYLLSHSCLVDHPEVFFEFYRQKMDARKIEPNAAHRYLAKLEKEGKLSAVVTQNIDGLHQKAGSKKVYELHGTTLRNYCSRCGKEYDADYLFDSPEPVPRCSCGGVIRCDVTLYEENLPSDAVNNAVRAISQADLLIIGGTSLTVYPAASFIQYFSGEHLAVINRDPVPVRLREGQDLEINESIGKVFSEIDAMGTNMRTFAFAFYLLLFAIVSPFIWLVLVLIRAIDKKKGVVRAGRIAFYCLRFSCRVGVFFGGIKPEITGWDNIPDGTNVYILNHRSVFDIVVFYSLMKKHTAFIAKKELRKVPGLSTWMTLANCYFLDRSDIRQGMETILKGIDNINNGISMAIFPEGTRNKDREDLTSLLPFHAGSFKLAQRTGAPVVPAVFFNTAEIFENHVPWMKKTRVLLNIEKPVRYSDVPKEEQRFIPDRVYQIMRETLQKQEASFKENR